MNSAALKLAGVDAGTPEPDNGRIDRDPDGTPSGLLHERARALVEKFVPETRTAGMLTPYAGACGCGGTGISHLTPELLGEVVTQLDAAGFGVHVHAIGDRAVREALDAFARARAYNGRTGNRHHIAHLQLVQDVDLPRFAELGVVANLQAVWVCRDSAMISTSFPVLGAERAQGQLPFGALHRSGARLALGSDWPVSTPDVLAAIHVAVNRTPPGDPAAEPLGERQALDLATAPRAGTVGSAWLNGLGECRVHAGAPADLTVLGRDPFAVPVGELHLVRAALTVAGGRVVHHG